MRRKLNILHIISSLDEGGAAKGTAELVAGLRATGEADARLCVLGSPPRAPSASGTLGEVEFLDCPVGRRALGFRRWRRLRGVVSRLKPDIVHSHLWPTAVNVAWALRGTSIPHVVHIRDSPPAFAERRWQSVLKRMFTAATIRSSGPRLVAVSQAAADYTARHLSLPPDRIRVLLNAVDLADFLAVDPPEFDPPGRKRPAFDRPIVVGAAGRLVESKGHRHLLDAVVQLRNEGLPIVLRIAGTGGQREALERRRRDSPHAAAITIGDYRPDVQRFYEQLDIYVLPSLAAEGLSRSLIEAMACGRPIVATDCEGTREAVRDRQEGLIVPVGDTAALAAAIRELATQPGTREQFGRAGRTRAGERFSLPRLLGDVLGLYREIVRSGTASPERIDA